MVGNKESKIIKTIAVIALLIIGVSCALPFLIIVSASFSKEAELVRYGYSLLPRGTTLAAYKMLFAAPGGLLKAYGVTIFTTIAGTCLSIVSTTMMAYALSRSAFKWRSIISFYMFFTMLFHGGAVASYIVIADFLNLRDNILVLIIPGCVSAWNVILIRTFMTKDLGSYIEAAKIDGASEYRILLAIVAPMVKTGITVIVLKTVLNYWGEWYNCLMYMPKEEYITLQYYLQKILSSVQSLQEAADSGQYISTAGEMLPLETVRMAICVIATAPMLIALTPFQKYFIRGINLGGVKG